ncbi:MAG: hypothetical protein J7M26_09060, partial [Armatimonadetes bacterium]|nr:hypothetical protein [Armatimonadota bacterium]
MTPKDVFGTDDPNVWLVGFCAALLKHDRLVLGYLRKQGKGKADEFCAFVRDWDARHKLPKTVTDPD